MINGLEKVNLLLQRHIDNVELVTALFANNSSRSVKVSVTTIVRAFIEAEIIKEKSRKSYKTFSDYYDREPGLLGTTIVQILNSDTEDEKFDRFVKDE